MPIAQPTTMFQGSSTSGSEGMADERDEYTWWDALVVWGVVLAITGVTLFLPADVDLGNGAAVELTDGDQTVTWFQGLSCLALMIAIVAGAWMGNRLVPSPRHLPWSSFVGGVLSGLPLLLWTTYRVRSAGHDVPYPLMLAALLLLSFLVACSRPTPPGKSEAAPGGGEIEIE
jgi:hypothetical protein